MRATEKKTGRPSFGPHRTMNVYLPNDLHDRLAAQAHRLKTSRAALIRRWLETGLSILETDAKIIAKQAKVLR